MASVVRFAELWQSESDPKPGVHRLNGIEGGGFCPPDL